MFSLNFLLNSLLFIVIIYLILLFIEKRKELYKYFEGYFEGYQNINPKHLEKNENNSYPYTNGELITNYTSFMNPITTNNMFQINN